MSNKEIQDFVEKIDLGLRFAEKRMLQEKSSRGETVVVCTDNNKIEHIKASLIIANNAVFQD